MKKEKYHCLYLYLLLKCRVYKTLPISRVGKERKQSSFLATSWKRVSPLASVKPVSFPVDRGQETRDPASPVVLAQALQAFHLEARALLFPRQS